MTDDNIPKKNSSETHGDGKIDVGENSNNRSEICPDQPCAVEPTDIIEPVQPIINPREIVQTEQHNAKGSGQSIERKSISTTTATTTTTTSGDLKKHSMKKRQKSQLKYGKYVKLRNSYTNSNDGAKQMPSSNNETPTRVGLKRKLNEDNAVSDNVTAGPSTSTNNDQEDDKEGDKDAKKKKNRCAVCRKKVGLTGFECRCGGLYCAVHRYSDKHNCTFDYRGHGAQEIRRNNPVVVGEKIQKI